MLWISTQTFSNHVVYVIIFYFFIVLNEQINENTDFNYRHALSNDCELKVLAAHRFLSPHSNNRRPVHSESSCPQAQLHRQQNRVLGRALSSMPPLGVTMTMDLRAPGPSSIILYPCFGYTQAGVTLWRHQTGRRAVAFDIFRCQVIVILVGNWPRRCKSWTSPGARSIQGVFIIYKFASISIPKNIDFQMSTVTTTKGHIRSKAGMALRSLCSSFIKTFLQHRNLLVIRCGRTVFYQPAPNNCIYSSWYLEPQHILGCDSLPEVILTRNIWRVLPLFWEPCKRDKYSIEVKLGM